MDHPAFDKFLVMGFCIDGRLIWNPLRKAPDRIVAYDVCAPPGPKIGCYLRTGLGHFGSVRADMTLELLTLITISVACDVLGQTFFKLGAIGIGCDKPRIIPSLWVTIGLVVYVAEIFVWLGVLAIAPLTVAAPIASLNYIGVILVSRWLFHEHITRRQWAGAGLVTLGVIAVALTGG